MPGMHPGAVRGECHRTFMTFQGVGIGAELGQDGGEVGQGFDPNRVQIQGRLVGPSGAGIIPGLGECCTEVDLCVERGRCQGGGSQAALGRGFVVVQVEQGPAELKVGLGQGGGERGGLTGAVDRRRDVAGRPLGAGEVGQGFGKIRLRRQRLR